MELQQHIDDIVARSLTAHSQAFKISKLAQHGIDEASLDELANHFQELVGSTTELAQSLRRARRAQQLTTE